MVGCFRRFEATSLEKLWPQDASQAKAAGILSDTNDMTETRRLDGLAPAIGRDSQLKGLQGLQNDLEDSGSGAGALWRRKKKKEESSALEPRNPKLQEPIPQEPESTEFEEVLIAQAVLEAHDPPTTRAIRAIKTYQQIEEQTARLERAEEEGEDPADESGSNLDRKA